MSDYLYIDEPEGDGMSREYAETKIREALKLCNGNTGRARQQIITLAQDVMQLLKDLVRPHLDGIVAYQIERVASGRAELEKRHPKIPLPDENENFGMELLRAIASEDVTIFGQDDHFPRKRKGTSKQHIDAIHQMAASARKKKK